MEVAELSDPELAGQVAAAAASARALQAAVGAPVLDDDLLALQRHLELLARQIGSAQLEAQGEIERRGLHRRDGHASARVMARHVLSLSDAEASRRQRAVRALRELPLVREAFAQAEIGADQVDLIARIHANPRVRSLLPEAEKDLLNTARSGSFRDLALHGRQWERLMDTDGAFRANELNHERRDAKLIQDPIDLGWTLTGSFAAEQGARLREILDHYIEAEWRADWDEARARLGEAATAQDLARTDSQRRADALARIFADAAASPPGSRAPKVVHTVVWSAETYFGLVDALANGPGGGGGGADGGGQPGGWRDPATYRCHTINGVPLEPVEALAFSLANHVRRAVIDARGVVIELGASARLFTGSARTAVQLQHPNCIWPGCQVPVNRCEADHLHPHARGGGTSPANGAPLCGFHNRWKQKGYATARGPDGRWHTYRSDGTEIT